MMIRIYYEKNSKNMTDINIKLISKNLTTPTKWLKKQKGNHKNIHKIFIFFIDESMHIIYYLTMNLL